MTNDRSRQESDKKPSPVQQADDRGRANSEPASTTDKKPEPDSALGGRTATKSRHEPAPNPAEERSE